MDCNKVKKWASAEGHPHVFLSVAVQVWAKRFQQLLALVQEVEAAMGTATAIAAASGAGGGAAAVVSPEDLEPLLTLMGLEGSKLKVQYRGVTEVKVSSGKGHWEKDDSDWGVLSGASVHANNELDNLCPWAISGRVKAHMP